MTKRFALPLAVALAVPLLAACSSSPNTSTSSSTSPSGAPPAASANTIRVCSKIRADAVGLLSIATQKRPNAAQVAAELRTTATKLDADARAATDRQLKAAIRTLASALNKEATLLSGGKVPEASLRALAGKLTSSYVPLERACAGASSS